MSIKQRDALLAVYYNCVRDRSLTIHETTFAKVTEALAEPIRNCDIGTAEEQMERQHYMMCNTTKACPDSDWSCRKCFAEWAQIPYEEGERNDKTI